MISKVTNVNEQEGYLIRQFVVSIEKDKLQTKVLKVKELNHVQKGKKGLVLNQRHNSIRFNFIWKEVHIAKKMKEVEEKGQGKKE